MTRACDADNRQLPSEPMRAQINSLSESHMAATPIAWLVAGPAAAQHHLQRGGVNVSVPRSFDGCGCPRIQQPAPSPPRPPRDTDVSLARLLAALSHRPCFLAGRCVGLWASLLRPTLLRGPRSGRSAARDICEIWDGHSAASLGRLVLPNEASYFDSLIFDEGSPQSKSPY